MNKNSTKVLVGMSGGVDSSVAALLLLQAGYQVEGVFMKNWEEDDTDTHCSASADVADARQVCDRLGIKLHTVNFAAEYWDRVFRHFLHEYKEGRTPNPDILCNREIKFKSFLEYAQNLGADYIATGHYASKLGADGLGKAADRNKDQSYFLHALTADQLRNALFPLAGLTKPQVRALAAKAGFANHRKKDSTGICFIGERKFKAFLQNYLPAQPGAIITDSGSEIGQHDGLMFYTIGQRQGLNIGGRADAANEPWFVIDKDLTKNQLIVAQGQQHPRLFAPGLVAQQLTWIQEAPADLEFSCMAKIRYRQEDQACTLNRDPEKINPNNNSCNVIFAEPQRAITPGQSIVFYQGDRCLGGGIIQEHYYG